MNKTVIIGTRGSELALWQAHFLQDQLKEIGVESQLEIITTKGDAIQNLSFDKIEGKGFFTKEIEDALLAQKVDIAVHSMKDLPTQNPEGLVVAAVSYREDHRDCLLVRKEVMDDLSPMKLKENAVVGTSSSRRKAQILALNPSLNIKDIRGNVPTRIRKLREKEFDAILLAAAGLTRLKLDVSDLHVIHLHAREFVPAPAQGVLAFQCREDDFEMREMLAKIHHEEVASCTNVERSVLKMMGGGCHMPLGVYCEKDANGFYHVHAAMSDTIDEPLRRVTVSQSTTHQLAENVYQQIKK